MKLYTAKPSNSPSWWIATILAPLLLAAHLGAQETNPWKAFDLERPQPSVVTPAPPLAQPQAAPSDAEVLFDGKDLSKWRSGNEAAKWNVVDGFMEAVPGGGTLSTADNFGDIQLHIEWSAPTPAQGRGQGRGNSGVFFMDTYEVQILDNYQNDTYPDGQAAAIYGQCPPLVNACRPPGEWQSYDIVFRRPRFSDDGHLQSPATFTILHNGVLVQDNSHSWGNTAWVQYNPYVKHADALPLSLQDHGNPVRFRNIWVRRLDEPRPMGPPARAVAQKTLTREQLDKLAGEYGEGDGKLVFRREEDTLQVQNTGRWMDLVPITCTEFTLPWTASKIKFERDEQGRPVKATFQFTEVTWQGERSYVEQE